MPSTTWQTADGRWQVVCEPGVLGAITQAAARAAVRETGGILLGHYDASGTIVTLTEAVSPTPDTRAGPTWLVRGVAGLRLRLDAAWRDAPRTYYVGEWHSHPGGAPSPSARDLATMRRIAGDARASCTIPVLLIIGDEPLPGSVSAYLVSTSVVQPLPQVG